MLDGEGIQLYVLDGSTDVMKREISIGLYFKKVWGSKLSSFFRRRALGWS